MTTPDKAKGRHYDVGGQGGPPSPCEKVWGLFFLSHLGGRACQMKKMRGPAFSLGPQSSRPDRDDGVAWVWMDESGGGGKEEEEETPGSAHPEVS